MTNTGEPKFTFVDSTTVPWINSKFAQGVQVKNLGKANGRYLQLVRFEPGAEYPHHFHHGAEFIYLLEGDAIQNGQKLTAGWAAIAEQGTVDDAFRSENGCLFLFCYAAPPSSDKLP